MSNQLLHAASLGVKFAVVLFVQDTEELRKVLNAICVYEQLKLKKTSSIAKNL